MKTDCSARHTFAVCAYGESPFLEDCLRSLLCQSVRSRILLSTSTDNPHIRGLAEKYGLPLFISGRDPDIAGDWNRAYRCAETPYVTLAHQDDVYAPDYAGTAVRMLDDSRKPLLFFSDYYEIRDNEEVDSAFNLRVKRALLMPMRVPAFRGKRFFKRAVLSLGNPVCCPSVTFAREHLPYVVFQGGMKSNLDWNAWANAADMRGEFVYAPVRLMGHRIHTGSTTTALIKNQERTMEDMAVLRRFWPAPAAAVINRIYRNAERSNRVRSESRSEEPS